MLISMSLVRTPYFYKHFQILAAKFVLLKFVALNSLTERVQLSATITRHLIKMRKDALRLRPN